MVDGRIPATGNSNSIEHCSWGTGGGASHIATTNGILSSLNSNKLDIILIGGGGGGSYATANSSYGGDGGHGGGFQGGNGTHDSVDSRKGMGGTQTSGGSIASSGTSTSKPDFGYGGGGISGWYTSASGGGGLYGGSAGGNSAGGGGGSGYINTSKLTNAFMYGYNVPTSNDTATKTYSTTNVSSTPTSNYAKSGDGAARITPIN